MKRRRSTAPFSVHLKTDPALLEALKRLTVAVEGLIDLLGDANFDASGILAAVVKERDRRAAPLSDGPETGHGGLAGGV